MKQLHATRAEDHRGKHNQLANGANRRADTVLIVCCFLFNLLFFLLIALGSNVVFATNDDYRMRLIISGAYTGTPSSQAVYLNTILSSFLAFLYRINPGVEWYGLFHYISMYLCASAIECGLLCRFRGAKDLVIRLLCVGLFSGTVVLRHILLPQFTMTAAFYCAAALVFELRFMEPNQTRGRKALWLILALLASFLAILVRRKVFLMASPLLVAYAVIVMIRHLEAGEGKRCLAILGSLVGIAAIYGICFGAQTLATASPDYQEFWRFNVARSEIYDYTDIPDYEENKEFYDSIDFPHSAYLCLTGRTFDIHPAMTAENLEKIAEYADSISKAPLKERLVSTVTDLWDALLDPSVVWQMMTLVFVVFVLFELFPRKLAVYDKLFVVGSVLYLLLAIAMLIFRGRIMPRVIASFIVMVIPVFFQIAGKTELVNRQEEGVWALLRAALNFLLVFVMVFSLIVPFIEWCRDETESRMKIMKRTEMLGTLESYMQDHPDDFVYYHALNLIGASDSVFRPQHEDIVNMDSLGNWEIFAPDYMERNAQFGFSTALGGLLRGENVYYAEVGDSKHAVIEETLNEFGKTLTKHVVLQGDGYKITIYRCEDMEATE